MIFLTPLLLALLVLMVILSLRTAGTKNERVARALDSFLAKLPRSLCNRVAMLMLRPPPLVVGDSGDEDGGEDEESYIPKIPQVSKLSIINGKGEEVATAAVSDVGPLATAPGHHLPLAQSHLVDSISVKKVQGFTYREGYELFIKFSHKLILAYFRQMHDQQDARQAMSTQWPSQSSKEVVLANSIISPVLIINTLTQLGCMTAGATQLEILAALGCPKDHISKEYRSHHLQRFVDAVMDRLDIISDGVTGKEWRQSSRLVLWTQENTFELNQDRVDNLRFSYPSLAFMNTTLKDTSYLAKSLEVYIGDRQSLIQGEEAPLTRNFLTSLFGNLAAKASGVATPLDIQQPERPTGLVAFQIAVIPLVLSKSQVVHKATQATLLSRVADVGSSLKPGFLLNRSNGGLEKHEGPFLFRDHLAVRNGTTDGTPIVPQIKHLVMPFVELSPPPAYARFFHCYYKNDKSQLPTLSGLERDFTTFGLEVPLCGSPFTLCILMPYRVGLFDITPQQITNTICCWDTICMENRVHPIEQPRIKLPEFSITSASYDMRKLFNECGLKTCFQPAHADFSPLCAKDPVSETPKRQLWLENIGQFAKLVFKATTTTSHQDHSHHLSNMSDSCITIEHAFYFALLHRLPGSTPKYHPHGETTPAKPVLEPPPSQRFAGRALPVHVGYVTDPTHSTLPPSLPTTTPTSLLGTSSSVKE